MDNHLNTTCSDLYHKIHISWGAIFAGAFTALGLGFLLQLFGLAIGLSAYHFSDAGANTLAIGGFIALVIGVIVSMGVAGYVSGYFGRYYHYNAGEGFLYGFLTWCMALLLSAILMMPLAHYASHYSDTLAPKGSVSHSQQHNLMSFESDVSSSKTQETNNTQTSGEVTSHALIGSSWLLFLLFLIGAICSCVAAFWAMECRRKCRPHIDVDPRNPTVTRTREI